MAEEQAFLGRVVEANITRFSVECYELDGAPPLGSLVAAEERWGAIYAIVCDVETSSIEQGRRPLAHTPPDVDVDQIMAHNPQLRLLLRTSFEALAVGYYKDGEIGQNVPPSPPRIYARVQSCSVGQVRAFFGDRHFLKLLVSSPASDEVTAASLRQAAGAFENRRSFLLEAGRDLIGLLGQDPSRLMMLLRSMAP